MRIAFVAPLISQTATGLSSYLRDLVPRLCDAGHKLVVVGSDCGYRGVDSGELIELDCRAEFRIFKVRGTLNRRAYRSSDLIEWLQSSVEEFDVVDIQGVWSWIAADAARICAMAGVPYVITPHGMMTTWDWAKQPLLKRAFFTAKFRQAWKQAAAIRYLSEGELRASQVAPWSKFAIIPNAVAAPEPVAPEDVGRETRKLNLESGSRIVLFLGRVTKQKGVLELVRAFRLVQAQVANTILVIAGPIEEQYGELLYKEVSQYGNGRVHILGPVFGTTKTALFEAASIFVTLSKNEGLSIAALEALSVGLPVVVTKASNLPEVETHTAGITTTTDPEQAARDMCALLNDTTRLEAMRVNARSLADECFGWDAVLPRLISMYHDAAFGAASAGVSEDSQRVIAAAG